MFQRYIPGGLHTETQIHFIPIKENRFHIYAVGHVTGAAKVLLKTQWGEPDDNTSISGKICDRLDAIGAVKNLKPWWHLW